MTGRRRLMFRMVRGAREALHTASYVPTWVWLAYVAVLLWAVVLVVGLSVLVTRL